MDINLFENDVELVNNPISRKEKLIIIQGGEDRINRLAVSNKNIDILLDPQLGTKQDFLHNRNSGLNQVLCKLAKKNKVAIGFSFNNILKNSSSKILGRIIQNIKLCRKYKLTIVVGNFSKSETRNINDIHSFYKTLGMTGKELQDGSNYKEHKLDYKRRYITKGVMKC
ncbi:MAG: RNase P subunit p30 family protein [archaeon]